ncbi:glycosyltransferase family 25 protein [Pseudorhodoferax sp. Leaf274]|uniref:glycosyltransferase family 25 protein n=1 Tax=Pseudorhodoferax sp. Leaf274 TaxID=1736318 RepID=UPI0007030EE1|nr:glycosyltransferase family 25 protein [Pseudorhodoferax sp. Leaf274]KQP43199.1 hypothetical protein ASF44_06425 [Pseudorhodoferax sp. Leaf274]
MTKTAIRVISMESATKRRTEFGEAANGCGLDWAFFPALRQAEAPLRYDMQLAVSRFGRPLKPGEIGCYASHYALWGWFLASDYDQLVVLEDDTVVDWPAIAPLCRHDLSSHGIDILKLFSTHPLNARVAKYKLLSDHSHLLSVRGLTLGTQAYLLTRTGATALHRSCNVLCMPVDWAMSRYWDYGVRNYCLFPFPVLERHGPSTIGHSAQEEFLPTARQRAARLSWKIRERAARASSDLFCSRHPFGKPQDQGAASIN